MLLDVLDERPVSAIGAAIQLPELDGQSEREGLETTQVPSWDTQLKLARGRLANRLSSDSITPKFPPITPLGTL